MSKGEDEEQPTRGFKVQDRRRFTETSEAEERSEPSAPRAVLAPAPEPRPEAARSEPRPESAPPPLEMTFSTFVISLTTQALVHLGEVADPAGQQVGVDLGAAKQMIDLLGILSDKTKGNLDAAEDQLLGTMLYDLRMRYVEVSRQS